MKPNFDMSFTETFQQQKQKYAQQVRSSQHANY